MSMYPQSDARRFELEYGTDDKVVFNFFNAVYAWMAVGLAVTAVVAWLCSQNPAALRLIYGTKGAPALGALAAFAIAWTVQGAALRLSAGLATVLFLIYAALIGALLSGIFLVYSQATIVSAFVITGGVFAGMSVYGFVTKRDLTRVGSILVMCALGLFAASIVNVFVASSALDWFITYAVLAVFIGIIAYKTQQLKEIALTLQASGGSALAARYAIVGSLQLYISFINIFVSILRIMGSRR